jgi:hypothetical protein
MQPGARLLKGSVQRKLRRFRASAHLYRLRKETLYREKIRDSITQG